MTCGPANPAKRTANEGAIQRLIKRLVEENALLASIEGTAAVRQAAAARRGPDIIPTLSVDSLQRERIILAADEALNALGDVEIISDNTSISRSAGEILRPDFVLFNRKLGRLILVELKDDKLPERQAVTELLAYERELRNHFPFIGGLEIVFVLVAREWSDLLNHAYAALAARGRPSLLALTVSGEEPVDVLPGNHAIGKLARQMETSEPPRVCRRLQLLRRWSHDEQDDEQVCAGSPRARGADGFRSRA